VLVLGVHERLRAEVAQLKSQLLLMLDSPTEALKPLVLKFMEVVVLTLTNDKPNPAQRQSSSGGREELRPFTLRELPPHHSVLDASKLREEAQGVLQTLLSCQPTVATTFSSLLKSLSSLAKLRGTLFARQVVERLETLAELILMEEVQLQVLPNEQQVKRVKTDIKSTLIDVLKNINPIAVPDAQVLIGKLVQELTSLGFEMEAREAQRQVEKKLAAMVAQQQRQAAVAVDLTASSSAAGAGAAGAAAGAGPSYDLIASADAPEMRMLAFHLAQLPAYSITQLVMSSLQHFVPPVSTLHVMQTREVSNLFAQFVAACSEGALPGMSGAAARGPASGVSLGQRQAAEQMLAQAAMATSTAPDAAPAAAQQQQLSMLPSKMTVVPPVPIPTITEKGYESLARSAFARIASSKTQASVSRSGESALRNVILAKLATGLQLHPLRYTHTIDPELDASDPAADAWHSSLVATENHQLLLSFITKAFHETEVKEDWDGYENALSWLYTLLAVDGSAATIDTKLKEKEHSGAELAAEGDEAEEEHKEGSAAAAAAGAEEHKEGDADAEMSTPASVAATAGSKRKRDDAEANGAVGADEDGSGAKRAKSEAVGAAASSSSAAEVTKAEEAHALASTLRPSVLPEFGVHGTVEYEETLARLLHSLESSPLFGTGGATTASNSRQNLYCRFLLDIPLLTPAVFASLDGCVYDPARAVIGLSTLRDLILYRPPVREQCMQLLLGYTYKPDQSKLRNQSIRLVVNQLFTPHPHLRARIVAHANQLLDGLADPATLEDLPEIVVNVVVPPMPIYDKIVLPPIKEKAAAAAAPATPAATDAATAGTDPAVKSENTLPAANPALSSTASKTRAQREEIAQLLADAERHKKEFDRLVFFRSLKEKEKKLLEQQRDERNKRRTDRITRHMELYLALCTRQPSLLRRVLQVYRRCGEFVRKCMHEQIPPLINALVRLDVDTLIQVLEAEATEPAVAADGTTAADSEALVLLALKLMTDRTPPTPTLVAAVMRMYQARQQNPRFLVPVLPALPADAIRRHLPRLITLPAEQLRAAFTKLFTSKPAASIKPAELLVALHTLQPEPRRRPADAAPLSDVQIAKERKEDEEAMDKLLVVAKKICLDDTAIFTSDVLATVLNQLSDVTPLPRLLLHTLILCLRMHPSLRSFIVSSLLLKLIARKVYLTPLLWSGFLRAANELRPHSLSVLVQLPDAAFEQLLLQPSTAALPLDELRTQLTAFVQQYPSQVRLSIRRMLQLFEQNKAAQRQMELQRQQQMMMQHLPAPPQYGRPAW
jgi:hypothetical protein